MDYRGRKIQKSGYINYNFGPNVDISTIWSTIGSIINICTVAIFSVGKVYKTHSFERLEEIAYKKSTPCEDLALIKELDNEINEIKFIIYSFEIANIGQVGAII